MKLPKPAITIHFPGKPRSKENKGAFNRGFYFRKHSDIVDWEAELNELGIEAMQLAGFPGPYKGRCRITTAITYESWKKCDVTNYWKSLNDALEGAVWVNDCQVDDANIVRYIDRKNPGIYNMIWFYDLSFEEAYPKKKYPDTYSIFDLVEFTYRPNVGFVSKPEDAPTKRYGKFERKLNSEERAEQRKKEQALGTVKATPRVNKRKSVSNEKAKAEASRSRSGSGGARKKSTKRRRAGA